MLSLGALLIVFSGGSIKASAALPSGGKFLTAEEIHNIVGDTITGRYYDGTSYVDIIYNYLRIETITGLMQHTSSDIVTSGKTVCVYSAPISNVNLDPDYITFDLYPEYTIQDTSFIYTFIGHSMSSGISSSVYSPPRWEWNLNGRTTVFQDANLLNPNQTEYAHFQTNSNRYYTYAECNYSSNLATSGYSLRASFYGASQRNQVTACLAIGVAYISDSGSGQSGTLPVGVTTAPTTNVTVNVNVDVDMTETNSLLDHILGGISGLIDGIKGLFVPSQEDLVNWRNDVVDMLEDTFTGVPQLEETMIDTIEDLINVNSVSVLEFPGIAPPGADGRPIQIVGARDVSLKPNGFNDLFDFVRLAINIAATIAVFNMIQHRLKGILVGEKVVETDGD